jgi:hypothetical protein
MREDAMKRVSVSIMRAATSDIRGRNAMWRASNKMLMMGLLALAVPMGMGSALAADVTVGNPATKRASVDTYSNFTVIDTNHPVSATGFLSVFQYYAGSTKPFEFVLVDKNNVVQWTSPTITPAAEGVQAYTAAAPVSVQAGWNLGVHADSSGVIPFDGTGADMVTTANNAGKPAVGSALVVFKIPSGTYARTYSMNAATAAAAAASANAGAAGDECKADTDCGSGMTCATKTKNKTNKKTGKKTSTQVSVCEAARAEKEKSAKSGSAKGGNEKSSGKEK